MRGSIFMGDAGILVINYARDRDRKWANPDLAPLDLTAEDG